ncbi:threonine synthase [Carnobacteriaceae bacterium zg-ZUI78]|nr:threonine synthase [Carnobacteriaceae bacterium zg-ZUI78]
MSIIYQSTRDAKNRVSASQAILKGIAEDGGLYVPQTFPTLPVSLEALADMSYQEIAFLVLRAFLSDFSDDELRACVNSAYSTTKFDIDDIVSIQSFGNKHYLELFHGETIAFKDMALSILPYLMSTAAKKNGSHKDILILTATSGDTGKAAMAGFADVPHTKIIVFYPKGGVSHIQELQMLTQKGDNTHVIGITGNFDDAQSAVKAMFTDTDMIEKVNQAGYQFSSANSINIGRLMPQVAYYVYAYAQLVKNKVIRCGESINVSVPTGNFGNILAAYYAKQIGLPIDTFICASNKNNVLSDFFATGTYNKNRPFYVTNSPSMDILISSNLERLIYHAVEQDTQKTRDLMHALSQQGEYHVDLNDILSAFYGDFATEDNITAQIKRTFDNYKYLIDPHTAVSDFVYDMYAEKTGDNKHVVIASTASPYKFPKSVMSAFRHDNLDDDMALVDALETLSNIPQPQAVLDVKQATIRHHKVVSVEEMAQSVLDCLS